MKKTIQITIVLLFSSLAIFGQTKETKQADIYFENLSFVKAALEYKKLAEKKPTAYILKKLGDCYYNNVQMEEAADAYARLFTAFVDFDDEDYAFKYAQSLRAIGNFEESKFWMKKFNIAKKEDVRGQNFTAGKAILAEIRDNKPDYRVENLEKINTKYSDFGVTEYKNTILFSSPRDLNRFVKRTHTRNDRNFLDIFQVNKDDIKLKGSKNPFSKELNEKYHESSISFSPDNKTIYFTRNNYNEGDYKVDKDGYNKLKIYKADLVDDNWINIKELPFCSNEYSVGHPSVSKDGKRLFFTSDMEGGFGKTDIYYVIINEDKTYGEPVNLGKTINTEGREMFPFMSEDKTLYFSSDGHFGIGALDVFASKSLDNKFQEPVNLKAPVNSKLDDFAFSINPITRKGYLSSNRIGGLGDDDIYSVEQIVKEEIKEVECNQVITGFVRESKFKKHLPFAKLTLKDALGNVVKDTIADKIGKFTFRLPCNQKFAITAAKEYYKPDTKYFETTDEVEVELDLDFSLEITDDFVYNERDELIIKINSIYFDYNKWNIRSDAALELDHIVSVMVKYPKIKVKSTSHTDARGRASYNELLSQRRAESTVDYITYKGIKLDRISGKGFGESQLTNKCVDNDNHTNRVKCTEAQHQANRRTSFVILNVDGTKISSKEKEFIQEEEEVEEEIEEGPQSDLKTHIVSKGETLYSIAEKYKLEINLLKKINNLKSNNVYLNQLLIIDPNHNGVIAPNVDVNKSTYTVKANETLYAIAVKHNLTVKKLKSLNKLKSNSIKKGQVLKIK